MSGGTWRCGNRNRLCNCRQPAGLLDQLACQRYLPSAPGSTTGFTTTQPAGEVCGKTRALQLWRPSFAGSAAWLYLPAWRLAELRVRYSGRLLARNSRHWRHVDIRLSAPFTHTRQACASCIACALGGAQPQRGRDLVRGSRRSPWKQVGAVVMIAPRWWSGRRVQGLCPFREGKL